MRWIKETMVAVVASIAGSSPAQAATFVYVANADDGNIGRYRLTDTGELQPGARTRVAGMVGPMAISPDRRFLYAASRAKPCTVHVFAIDPASGELSALGSSPLAESFPYISLDRTGRYLFGASYDASLISVNAIDSDGRVAAEPLQVIPVGRNAHAIRIDRSNRYVYVPSLGTDEIQQFAFDAKSGRLTANTPPAVPVKPKTGPRHPVISADNRFVYVVSEFRGTVITFALDDRTGLLREVGATSGMPANARLRRGAGRGAAADPGAPTRNLEQRIWAADIHLSPNGRYLYISERTGSTLSVLAVDAANGNLEYRSSVVTEAQPRGFAIDPEGRFLIAAGERSETVSVYAIGKDDGALGFVAKYPTGRRSNWVEIVRFD